MYKTIDLRDPQSFAAGHVEGSLNIPYSPAIFHWAEILWTPDEKRTIVLPLTGDHELIKANLRAFDPNCEYFFLTFSDIEKLPLVKLNLIKPDEVDLSKYAVVDVRGPDEWKQSFMEGAIPMELSNLPLLHHTLPKDRPLAIICASGIRSSIGASFLKSHHLDAGSVIGGMNAWLRLKH